MQRLGDLHLLLHAEADGLLQERDVVGARRDRHQDLRLGRLDLRQVRRELRAAERVGRGAEHGAALLLERLGAAPGCSACPTRSPRRRSTTSCRGSASTHVPTAREVMVGFSASWKVMGLVSGLALISSDWLVEMNSTLDFLVCSLMAICTCAARPPTMNWHVLLLDQLLGALGAHRGLELVVAEEHLDLAAEDAALGVELVRGELGAALHVGGEGGEGAGERQRDADADRVLALRAQDDREAEGGGGGGGGGQECAAMHGGLLIRGDGRSTAVSSVAWGRTSRCKSRR